MCKDKWTKLLCVAVCMAVFFILFLNAVLTQITSWPLSTNSALLVGAEYFVAVLFLGFAKICKSCGEPKQAPAVPARRRR